MDELEVGVNLLGFEDLLKGNASVMQTRWGELTVVTPISGNNLTVEPGGTQTIKQAIEANIAELLTKATYQYVIEAIASVNPGDGNGFDYNMNTNPLLTTNPESVGATWINNHIDSGEVFVCVDKTPGANIWIGQLGTRIEKTQAPILSISSASANEGTSVIVTVDNHSGYTNVTYNIVVNGGSYVDNLDGTITWTMPSVESDTLYTMTVYATESGKVQSLPDTIDCTSLNLGIIDDSTGGVGIAGKLSYLASTIDELGATLHNATLVPSTEVSLDGPLVLSLVGTESTTTTLVTFDIVQEGDKILLDGTTEVDAGIVALIGSDDGAANASTTDSVPDMADNTSPEGVCFSSGPDTNDYKPFAADTALFKLFSVLGYVGYGYLSSIVINKFTVKIGAIADYSPETLELIASNTGDFTGEEVILSTESGLIWVIDEEKTFTLINAVGYLYYAIRVTVSNGAATRLHDIKFIESAGEVYSTTIPTQVAAPTSATLRTSITESNTVVQEVGETDFAALKDIVMITQGATVPTVEFTFDNGVNWHTANVATSNTVGADTTTTFDDIIALGRNLKARIIEYNDVITISKLEANIWKVAA